MEERNTLAEKKKKETFDREEEAGQSRHKQTVKPTSQSASGLVMLSMKSASRRRPRLVTFGSS